RESGCWFQVVTLLFLKSLLTSTGLDMTHPVAEAILTGRIKVQADLSPAIWKAEPGGMEAGYR
ncbi:MAG: hypothetical protein ACTH6V_13690, partial [Glutamicibacter arilaitensis]|uniref:hypothetical protein n=1 Tax=Glutamicibacter arilaitensis TaxID=256701 RepID=UPI003F8F46AD